MRMLIVLVLASLLLTGAVQQSYYQTVGRDGSSEIQRDSEIGLFADFLPPGSVAAMADICEAGILKCGLSEDDMVLTLYGSFDADGTYYSFESEEGIPYSTYVLTIKRVPTDRFGELTDDLLVEAGVAERSTATGTPVVLGDSETMSVAGELKALGVGITYIVDMPGEIVYARSDGIEGRVDYSTARFDLVDVMQNSGQIVVRSRELNLPYLMLIAIAVVLGALALSFFWEKKAKKKK